MVEQNGRNTKEYKEWRIKVFLRDNYKCKMCGSKEKINAHHIKSYRDYPSLRCDVKNGVCLCEKHHMLFHALYGTYGFTDKDFEEFSNIPLENLLDYNGDIMTARIAYCLEDNEIIYNIDKYTKENNFGTDSHIRECCRGLIPSYKGKHYMWYDEYLEKTEDEIKNYLESFVINSVDAIICTTTNQIFASQEAGAMYFDIHPCSIKNCCNGLAKTTGSNKFGKRSISWDYLDKFMKENNLSIEDIKNSCEIVLINTREKKKRIKKQEPKKAVICEGIEYNSIKECAIHYNIEKTTMQSWLNGINTLPTEWENKGLMYKDESLRIKTRYSSKEKRKTRKTARKVVCEGMVFDKIKSCSDYYEVGFDGMKKWLSGVTPMPLEWKEKGLRFQDEQFNNKIRYKEK